MLLLFSCSDESSNVTDIAKFMTDVAKFKVKEMSHIEASKMLFQSDSFQDQKEGFEYLAKEANEGSAYSIGKIGWAYQMGLGVDADLDKAKELYLSPARAGMTYWQFLLAHAYEMGYLGFIQSGEQYEYWLNFQPKIHIA